MAKKDKNDMTLAELREVYPDIKSNSKGKFLKKVKEFEDGIVVENDKELDEDEAYDNHRKARGIHEVVLSEDDAKVKKAIEDHVPNILMNAISVHTGCMCAVDNMIWFYYIMGDVEMPMQRAINEAYWILFKERVATTQCSPCLTRRIKRIQVEFERFFDISKYK